MQWRYLCGGLGGIENWAQESDEESKWKRVHWLSSEVKEPSSGRFYLDDCCKNTKKW